jgi:hypothetical protein
MSVLQRSEIRYNDCSGDAETWTTLPFFPPSGYGRTATHHNHVPPPFEGSRRIVRLRLFPHRAGGPRHHPPPPPPPHRRSKKIVAPRWVVGVRTGTVSATTRSRTWVVDVIGIQPMNMRIEGGVSTTERPKSWTRIRGWRMLTFIHQCCWIDGWIDGSMYDCDTCHPTSVPFVDG